MNPSIHSPSPPPLPNSNRNLQTAIVAVAVLIALGMFLTYRGMEHASKTLAKGLKEAFSTSENITKVFRSEVQRVISTHGNTLELAVSEGDEYFMKESVRRILGGNVYMGTTKAEIDARCTFRYHLNLADNWKLEVRSNICLVQAPRFRPSLPVAIQTGTMRRRAESGWARFDKHELLDELQASMSDTLAEKSLDERHVGAVRETCRQSVADFVRNWLLREEQWRDGGFSTVIVRFPDDPAPTEIKNPYASDSRPVIRMSR